MVAPDRSPLKGLVEIDETEIPQRRKDDPPEGGPGRSRQGKMLVAGAVEVHDNGGWVRLALIADFSAASLHAFINTNVAAAAVAKNRWLGGLPRRFRRYPRSARRRTDGGGIVLAWVHRLFANLKRLGARRLPRRAPQAPDRTSTTSRSASASCRRTRRAAFRSLLGIAVAVKPVTYNMPIKP